MLKLIGKHYGKMKVSLGHPSRFQKGDGLGDPGVWPEIHVIKRVLVN